MPSPPNLADTSTRVVETSEDVAAVWSKDLALPDDPVRDAIIAGQTDAQLAYQDAADYAAAQSDPLRATDEYLRFIAGDEYGTFAHPGESNEALRARMLAARATVSPEAIVAAANAILAPFTSASAAYFEHSDCWHQRSGPYYDVVGASNTAPIVLRMRFAFGTAFRTGDTVSVSLVSGNTAANGTFTVTVVSPTELSLDGSSGSGLYAGSGSVAPAADRGPWSSHVFAPASFSGPSYPDRVYDALAHRRAGGARTFSSAYGRQFWLVVPEISGIDNNVSACFHPGHSATDPEGFFAGAPVRTPGQLVIAHTTFPVTLDAAHAVGVMRSRTGTTLVVLPSSPSDKDQIAIWDFDRACDKAPIHVLANIGQFILYQGIPNVIGYHETTPGSFRVYQWDAGTTTWRPWALNATFAWGITTTAEDLYNAVVNAIEAIRGQSIRWWLWAEPALS